MIFHFLWMKLELELNWKYKDQTKIDFISIMLTLIYIYGKIIDLNILNTIIQYTNFRYY